MFKTIINKIVHKKDSGRNTLDSRKELEKKVVEGAKKTVKDYKQVFERLSKYDRAESH